jgi:hypothetical protein
MPLLVLYRLVTCSRPATQEHGWEQNVRWNVLVRKGNYTAAASECTFYSAVVLLGKSLRNARNITTPRTQEARLPGTFISTYPITWCQNQQSHNLNKYTLNFKITPIVRILFYQGKLLGGLPRAITIK